MIGDNSGEAAPRDSCRTVRSRCWNAGTLSPAPRRTRFLSLSLHRALPALLTSLPLLDKWLQFRDRRPRPTTSRRKTPPTSTLPHLNTRLSSRPSTTRSSRSSDASRGSLLRSPSRAQASRSSPMVCRTTVRAHFSQAHPLSVSC
jgi:hypothetical protein